MKKIQNPHDHYFRTAMSDHRVAKDFFQHHLPEKVLKVANLNSLKLEKSTFIDEHFRTSMVDILYSVNLNNHQGYFYVIVEHQRKPDKLMPYRLLRYLFRIMDHHLKKKGHNNTLPVIVPLVFFNGEKPYPYSTDLFTLFGDQETLARETLFTPFTLIDVTQISDEKLKEMRWAGIMEFVQKHIFARNFLPIIEELVPLLKYLEQVDAQEYLISTVSYFLQGNIENPIEIAKLLNERLSHRAGENIMSLAEKLEQKGFQRGLAEGRSLAEKFEEKGRAEGQAKEKCRIARQMLRQKTDSLFIEKVTGLSSEEIESLALEK